MVICSSNVAQKMAVHAELIDNNAFKRNTQNKQESNFSVVSENKNVVILKPKNEIQHVALQCAKI